MQMMSFFVFSSSAVWCVVCFRYISLSGLQIIRAVKSRKFYWVLNAKLIPTLESNRMRSLNVMLAFIRALLGSVILIRSEKQSKVK